ncbi:DEAD/DEAH box helicase family protein [Streptomyces tendae]|uniref:DEAD/DEAH box helicase family protein n=1 Tax=Streptomyces tendae TaxID=1932 RepID=UPI003652A771
MSADSEEPPRDRRRSFNRAERIALFLVADGQCSNCGVDLPTGWHGDHVQAWSKGGATDVVNGQALCPDCNLRKGSRGMEDLNELRSWQQETRELYHLRRGGKDGNFLVVATPGAGKTRLARTLVADLITRREIDKVIVVVPTAHLRKQWAEACAPIGIKLDYEHENGNRLAADYDGVAVTYHAVGSAPIVWRKLCSMQRTLVVFDEIHHAGDGEKLTWGPALREAFEISERRLLLSGTPFRSDGNSIPFIRYDDGRAVPDYNYDYGKALADGGVVRPAVFPAMDGESQWRRAGAVETTSVMLTDTDKKTVPPALRAALDPNGLWIPSVLREANEALTVARIDTPDAGGLVVAARQQEAYAYCDILEQLTGERPAIAVSDEPKATKVIERFSEGDSRWIVAVQMIAEGVDIPRLAVGVYASNIRTQMFFIQVTGRFVRTRGQEDETTARLFIPSIEPLLGYARDIEKTVDAVLADEEKRIRQDQDEASEGSGDGDLSLLPAYETVGSSEALHHATIASGEAITTEERERAQAILEAGAGIIPRSVTAESAALILRLGNAANPVPEQRKAQPKQPLLRDEKMKIRRLIQKKVSRLAAIRKIPYAHLNNDLNTALGRKVESETMEQLQKRLSLLDKWQSEV